MQPGLVKQRGPILLYDNTRSHVARVTLQKLTYLGYETLAPPPYFPDLWPTDYYIFKHFDKFYAKFRYKHDAETVFKDFIQKA